MTTHVVVTPARNEADNLRRLGACLVEQTWRPTKWIVVDNGSTDETGDVVRELAHNHSWIELQSIGAPESVARDMGGVRAFNAALATENIRADLITNLDADVSFDSAYFGSLRRHFEERQRLGIASGLCYEPRGDHWRPVNVTHPHLRGAARTYRRECLAELLPLEERLGWDGIDAILANVRGWETGTIRTLKYLHHRPTGSRDASRFSRLAEQGSVSYYMWYRPSYLLLRTAYRILADRDVLTAGLAWGYLRSAARQGARHPEPAVREFVHRNQSFANLARRAREATHGY